MSEMPPAHPNALLSNHKKTDDGTRRLVLSDDLERLFHATFPASVCICLTLIAPGWVFAQTNPPDGHEHGAVVCNESPVPGKRPPNMDCAMLVHAKFSVLPSGPLVWRFENFPTKEAAQNAATPASAVVEATGKIWLLTLSSKGGRSKRGTFVTETDQLPSIPSGPATRSSSIKQTWARKPLSQCIHTPDRRRGTCLLASNAWSCLVEQCVLAPAKLCLPRPILP